VFFTGDLELRASKAELGEPWEGFLLDFEIDLRYDLHVLIRDVSRFSGCYWGLV
jgi:hypothetical protein